MSNRIASVEATSCRLTYSPDEAWRWAGGRVGHRDFVFVTIRTDKGVTGYGEVGEAYYLPDLAVDIINRGLSQVLVGAPMADPSRLWPRLYHEVLPLGHSGIAMAALAGVDLALWDLWGRIQGRPVYALLGCSSPRPVALYASGGFVPGLDALRRELRQWQGKGFDALKIRGGANLQDDIARIELARALLGPDFTLMFDAAQPYKDVPPSEGDILAVAGACERHGFRFLEEPCGPHDVKAYRELSRRTDVLLACGENLYRRDEFEAFAGVVPILQPDVARAGGITNVRAIAPLAQELWPHSFYGSVSWSASAHLCAATPNAVMLETDGLPNPFRRRLVESNGHRVKDGRLMLSDAPGLGVEGIESCIRRNG